MKYDRFGQAYTDTSELCDMLYKNPDLNLDLFHVEDANIFNVAVVDTYADLNRLHQWIPSNVTIENFDQLKQSVWHMPAEYTKLDIAQHVLDLCKTQEELQRVGQELLLFQERDLFPLLQYLKYFVDTMRKNNIVWGLGRGSSTASYVLYLLGVHKINSIFYDLPIEEFLK